MCHASIEQFLAKHVHKADVMGRRVLEAGSFNENGSARSHIIPLEPREYIGIDMRPGPGVDLVLHADHLVQRFGREAFDIVISTEMLEHCEPWRWAVWHMCTVLRNGGLLVLTTRSPGATRHEHPGDYWRFTPTMFRKMFAGYRWRGLVPDPMGHGVLFAGEKRGSVSMDTLLQIHPRNAPEV